MVSLVVSECILGHAGTYVEDGVHHGKPVYKKSEGDNLSIYYWDDRDGTSMHGWWFGFQVGG